MNEDEVRDLLDTAGAVPVDADRIDPDHIIRAGRRGVVRKRIGVATTGTAAAVLAVVAAVGIPMAIGGGATAAAGAPEALPTAPVDPDFLSQWARADGAGCPLPETEETDRAAAYTEALFAGLAEIGLKPNGSCGEDTPFDGFYYTDLDRDAFYLLETYAFEDADPSAPEWANMEANIWNAEGLDLTEGDGGEACGSYPGMTCNWIETAAGPMLVGEGTGLDPTDLAGSPEDSADVPMISVMLLRGDIVIDLDLKFHVEPGRSLPTTEQLAAIAESIPVNQQAAPSATPTEADLIDDLAAAILEGLPGADVDLSTGEVVRLGPDITEYGGPVYGTGHTHMAFLLAELESGETVRFFLQAEPIDATDEPDQAADTYAQCADAECDITASSAGHDSIHRTIDGDLPSLTALDYGTAWMIGIGVEPFNGDDTPPVDFTTLDTILAALR
ncbi:hypothetical protein [Glycomyces paridis]|uniref:Uncharacterized protein n=1 Tax=Glycomyces paridis TaxID=2126555 RepID=A0A4S8P298_9ACTN|nr:hypothetical protein [Glycomyces paridis]THV23441.1 hypothetical protein E9998_22815 [Glycomyces paridis]